MKAIAAMSLNRVIGRNGGIPWHLPEDFKWFKSQTLGQVIVVGRKTFESFGRPLPGRLNLVVSSSMHPGPGYEVMKSLEDLDESRYAPQVVWVAGGASIYKTLLPRCTDLFLSVVNREYDGDTFFPSFEDQFTLVDVPMEQPDFEVRHYRRSDLC